MWSPCAPQDCVLFHDSVYHNISYGNLNATEAEGHKAADMAEIHRSIVTRFPDGYNTQVSKKGKACSSSRKWPFYTNRTIRSKIPKVF